VPSLFCKEAHRLQSDRAIERQDGRAWRGVTKRVMRREDHEGWYWHRGERSQPKRRGTGSHFIQSYFTEKTRASSSVLFGESMSEAFEMHGKRSHPEQDGGVQLIFWE